MTERIRKVSLRLRQLALLFCTGLALTLHAEEHNSVVLELKNGDRLTGEVLSENEERVVLSTPWNVAIFVPRSEIEKETKIIPDTPEKGGESSQTGVVASMKSPPAPGKSGASSASAQAAKHAKPVPLQAKVKSPPSESTPAKTPKRWKWDVRVGTDFIQGAKDREIYFAQTSLTYTRGYKRNPKQFLRNKVEYRVDYGKTDGQESANRMVAGNKLDFDIASDFYGYAALGAGYDQVRKIKSQYELGPGLGYHLLAQKTLALDTELGLNYQDRQSDDPASSRRVIQGRVGQELTWEVAPKVTLSEQAALLPFLDDLGEYQIRFQGNLGFGIVRYLSLNLTVLNLYDTLPASGVPNNEFQFRSSMGMNF